MLKYVFWFYLEIRILNYGIWSRQRRRYLYARKVFAVYVAEDLPSTFVGRVDVFLQSGPVSTVCASFYSLGQFLQSGTVSTVCASFYSLGQFLQSVSVSTVWASLKHTASSDALIFDN